MNRYIFMGGSENLVYWLQNKDYSDDSFGRSNEQWFWSCNRHCQVGEKAFVYLCSPLSRIVGEVDILGEPFYNDAQAEMFDNQHMQNKWVCEVGNPVYFGQHDALTMKNLKALFGVDWGWVRYPRGNTKVPVEILPVLQELINSVRQDKRR